MYVENENYTQDELDEMSRLRDVIFITLCNIRDEADRLSQEVIRMNKILEAHYQDKGGA